MPLDFQPLQANSPAPQQAPAGASVAPQGTPPSAPVKLDFQPLQAQATPPSTGALGTVDSAALGLGSGIAEGAHSVGQLASNVISSGIHYILPKSIQGAANKALSTEEGIGNSVINAAKDLFTPQTPFEKQAIAENPNVNNIANVAGDIGAQGAALEAPLNLATKVVSPVVSKLAPGLASAPVAQGAVTQGVIGAGVGAASNPDDPIRGAAMGGALGGALGGIGGAIGEHINTAGKVIDETIQDMHEAGQDPNSLTSLRVIQNNLKNEGLEYRNYDLKQEVKATVNDQLAAMRPDGYQPGDSPSKIMTQQVIDNIPKAVAQNRANYDPIDTNTQQFAPTNFQQALEANKDDLPVSLPKNPLVKNLTPNLQTADGQPHPMALTQNPTLNDMLSYRGQLDSTISQVKAQIRGGQLAKTDIGPYYDIRKALNTDIHTNAASIPYQNPANPAVKTLEDQLNVAEQYHHTNIEPFQSINKDGSLTVNPQMVNKVMSDVSTQLQARKPNYVKLADSASRLGDAGKSQLGWGLLENAFNRATTAEGGFNPSAMQSALTRMKASGVLQQLGGDELEHTAIGMSKALEAVARTKASAPQVGIVATQLQKLTHSRIGIGILRRIGQPDTSTRASATLLGSLFKSLKPAVQTAITAAGAHAAATGYVPGNLESAPVVNQQSDIQNQLNH